MGHYNYENMKSVPLNPQTLGSYDAVVIATDHSSYDYVGIVDAAKLVIDTRNATRRVMRHREKIVLCYEAMTSPAEEIRRQLEESARVKQSFPGELIGRIAQFAEKSAATLACGGQIVFFGNVGSTP